MASRLFSSHPSLFFHDTKPTHLSSSSSSRNFKLLNFPSPTLTSHSITNANSHDPDANSLSLSKNKIWVNPKSPRVKQLLKKSSSSRYNNNPLVKVTESLDSCQTEQEVSIILKNALGDKFLERDAVFILNKMMNSNNAPIVLNLFLSNINPSKDKEVILYNVTLKVFRKCKDIEGAGKLFDEMLQRGAKPDNITFSTIINCARMCGAPGKAVEWFEKMPHYGCEPDDITCSAMVYTYARVNNVEMALKLYERAKAEKWRLDTVTFSTLIRMYGMSRNYDGCLSVYEDMKVLGVKPNVAMYNTLLNAMLRAKRPYQTKVIYKEMTDNGISPDLITYAALLRVYVAAQFKEDALGVYKEMKEKGMEMSTVLYNVLLSMCGDVGCTDEAIEIFEDMRNAGTCQPDSWTFSSLITIYSCSGKCYGKAKQTDNVVKIFKQVLDLGTTPDDRFWCCLLTVMAQTPKEELFKLIDCIEKANSKLGSMVRYLVEEREGDGDFRKEASELFSSIDAEVKQPFCNCLIDLCVNLNVPKKAQDLLNLGLMLEIYTDVQSKSQTQWFLHLKKLSLGAALTALQVWIGDLSKALASGEDLPPLLGINTGQGKHKYSDKGLASVLESYLKELNAPFYEAPEQAGWFLMTKVAAKSWLESTNSTESIAASSSMDLNVPAMALHH
ncbi:putative Smr domain, tetratricopeptide-like helical domain, pentacotripeptide-repeat region of PRORP [Lupinus albus]|uniref:Putative Smr domain, tetratricopeptide-like helical domain, pentacotripeptide-repeat region of PRORP n=1 Tax=Lupinus albus TaxID=3870 RepID=A0A6A4PDY0_LUPAL|nr:putative Smr domain, tetratricopeptide-like helical domain, pentacotripeptide-repeat region of PRORP [Lupinus albus]